MKQEYDIILPPYEPIKVAPEVYNSGQVVGWGNRNLKTDVFYRESRGEGAVIAILDTAGVFRHPDLAENAIKEYDKNYSNSSGSDDVHGHGTHCAGIAAATDNGIGMIGIAPDAKLIAVKVLNDQGQGSFSWVAQGIRYVADIPDAGSIKGLKRIISLSLGGSPGSPINQDLANAIDYAISKGCIVVAAAGNSGDGSTSRVGAPANYAPVIAVASTSAPGNVRSPFSSTGEEVDVAAPGANIYSTYKNEGYAYLSGTSMACPGVAGVAALVLSRYPSIAGQSGLTDMFRAYSTNLGERGKDKFFGWGVPILNQFLDLDGGSPPPPPPPPPSPEPEPDKPDVPTLPKEFPATFIVNDFTGLLSWKPENEQAFRNMLVNNFRLKIVSNVETAYLQDVVIKYLRGWFSSRAMVIRPEEDIRSAAVWCAAFLQFNADDDFVFENWGIRMKLQVLELTAQDAHGTRVTVDQQDIATRAMLVQETGYNVARMISI